MMALFTRRETPPADVARLLAREDRVISWADVADGGVVLASTRGLWWPEPDGQRLIGWQVIDKIIKTPPENYFAQTALVFGRIFFKAAVRILYGWVKLVDDIIPFVESKSLHQELRVIDNFLCVECKFVDFISRYLVRINVCHDFSLRVVAWMHVSK